MQPQDIPLITAYWLQASPGFLRGMGADPAKMPDETYWRQALQQQLATPYPEKLSYCTVWEYEGKAIGHCNVNKILFGKEAFMHLHIWSPGFRQQGGGLRLLRLSLPYFFDCLQLRTLYCEPYALNPAPNKTLERAGFSFLEEYITVPGTINFEQPVRLWSMTRAQFDAL